MHETPDLSVQGMRSRHWLLRALFLIAALVNLREPLRAEEASPLSRSEIEKMVVPLLEWHPKTVVAIDIRMDGQADEFIALRSTESQAKLPDANSIFQVGSITKVFTGLLLAIGVQREEVKLTQAASELLPEVLMLPQRGTRSITLEELATHTSGLPRLPPDFAVLVTFGLIPSANPYSTLTENSIGRGLKLCLLRDEEFPEYSYSNLAVGMLGHALCHKAGVDYVTLLEERITGPLKMADTVMLFSDEQKQRYFVGHEPTNNVCPQWTFGMLEGCGGLSSTTSDLQDFLKAEQGSVEPDLLLAMQLSQEPRRAVSGSTKIGLGWHISQSDENSVWWHNGSTYGHSSFMLMSHNPRVRIVILCNQGGNPLAGTTIADQIGIPILRHLMRGEASLLPTEPLPGETEEKAQKP